MSETELYIRGAILVVLLIISAMFSSAETALTSITVSQIRRVREEDEETANILKRIKIKMQDMLSTILIGNNVVNIAATSIFTEMSLTLFSGRNATLISTVVMTILILLVGEITPKTYATQNSIKIAKLVSKPIEILSVLMKPVLFILTKITNFVFRVIGSPVDKENELVTEEDIRSLVDAGEEEGVLKFQEREMIQNIFEIDEVEVQEVMLPRIDIVGVSKDAGLKEIFNTATEYGFSRIPVYEGTIDNIIGILYAKDLLPLILEDNTENVDVTKLMRMAYYVPETKKVNHLLKELQNSKVHMAIVLDEYGGTEGLITIEDILEEIVGEIFDEYDSERDLIKKVSPTKYLVEGDISLEEINEVFNKDLPEDEFESLGGFIFSFLDRVPEVGDKIKHENLEMKVLMLENKRITRIEININRDDKKTKEKDEQGDK